MQRFVGLVVGLLLGTTGSLRAATYQVQIAHLEEKLFFRYMDTQGTPLHVEHHILPELEADLDTGELPARLLLPDRQIEAIDAAKDASGQLQPVSLKVTSPQASNPWTVVTWEGTPGNLAILRISSRQVHYQELREVAAKTDGTLRRLPVTGVPLFGKSQQVVPDFASTYLTYALDRGTFVTKMAHYATSFDGLSIVVGRNGNLYYPDTVYLLVQMPSQTQTYKVVFAWRDREKLREGDGRGGGSRND